MSTSIATSPRSGPRTPSRGQAPPVQLAKSSPVGKVYNYYLPENCEQYQKFGYDEAFLLGAFDRKSTFLRFLNVVLPKSFPKIHPTGKKSFITSANKVARFIKDQREHHLFLCLAVLPTYHFHFRLPRARYPRVPRYE